MFPTSFRQLATNCCCTLAAAILLMACQLTRGHAVTASDPASRPLPADIAVSDQKAAAHRIDALHLGVLINLRDPESVEIGRYYQAQRKIPDANVLEISLAPDAPVLSRKDFAVLHAHLNQWAGDRIEALVFTWRLPYRVDCMSLTAALALGFDESYCASGCQKTKPSAYYLSRFVSPWNNLRMRPAMMLATSSVASTKALIDRGIAADGSRPVGRGFVLKTSDNARNVRALSIPPHVIFRRGSATLRVIESNALKAERGIMFYFTGLVSVPDLDSNAYLPGAVGDHLTSSGGVLSGPNTQMTALEWLKHGLTGSYGTVVEPCNFPEKFPHPLTLFMAYAGGDTLIEAYWKSVMMPGQGLFVGEPLARPYGP